MIRESERVRIMWMMGGKLLRVAASVRERRSREEAEQQQSRRTQ